MLDANGTRHHLILGSADWMRSQSEGKRKWEYDPAREVLRLQAEIFTIRHSGSATTRLSPEMRRGAARDQYGHWYWIDDNATGILARWAAASAPEPIYPDGPESCPLPAPAIGFQPAGASAPVAPEPLTGLAVTQEGYLVVGSPTTGTLLVFDLYAMDGGPARIPLPAPEGAPNVLTQPFDMAALPNGNLLVLDRVHKLVWVLDNTFRPISAGPAPIGSPLTFQPKEGRARREPAAPPTEPIRLDASNPVAIEPLPDNSFWVLDTPDETDAPSKIWRYTFDGSAAPASVELWTTNLIEPTADPLDLKSIRGHEFAYVPDRDANGDYRASGLLYIADQSDNQAYALRVDLTDNLRLSVERRYYPLRHYTGAALVAVWSEGEAYYHQGKRWLPIKPLARTKYEEQASLVLPTFDGGVPGCVWHRLCIDACIPPETTVLVETRAADTVDDLAWQPWRAQPQPYRRPTGSEIPYDSLWSDDDLRGGHAGTWELLFQQTEGHYMQLRLTLVGNLRSTPELRALRVHYPRFSYLKAYLPALYRRDAASMHFVENFLANPEGILTTIESLIAQVQVLMDVRTVPDETVDWLANWLGLAFEPGWSDYQRRLLIAHAPYFFLRRGTRLGLLQAILVALCPQLGPEIFRDDVEYATIRIVERFLTRSQPGILLGDPTESELVTTGDAKTDAEVRAHRFVVLLPTTADADARRLVERVVELEKPAHTSFTIKEYWAFFRVGEIRLGLDTILGQGGRFELFQLGQTALAEGMLGGAFPENLTTRTVIGK